MSFEIQLILLFVCLIGTFIFAGTETGFVSWNRLKVSHLASTGSSRGKWGMFLIKNKSSLLSGVLIGSNICIIGASVCFNSIYNVFSNISFLAKIPSPESWFLTPVVVLFCEMLPKSLFRLYSFELTVRSIPVLLVTYFIALPVSFFVSVITGNFRNNSVKEEHSFKTKNREEMIMVAAEGARTGAIFESANYLFNNVLNLKNRTLSELMQPISRYQKEALRANDTISSLKKNKFFENERIIFDEAGLNPVGYINLMDMVSLKHDSILSDFMRPVLTLEMDTSVCASLKTVFPYQGSYILLKNGKNDIAGVILKKDLFSAIFCGNRAGTDGLPVEPQFA